jgi:hypothetical protein
MRLRLKSLAAEPLMLLKNDLSLQRGHRLWEAGLYPIEKFSPIA